MLKQNLTKQNVQTYVEKKSNLKIYVYVEPGKNSKTIKRRA